MLVAMVELIGCAPSGETAGGAAGGAADANASGGDGGGGGGGDPVDGLGPWTGHDNVPPSADPPFGLSPSQVPMLVAVGWDDNAYSGLDGSAGTGGLSWAVEMLGARTNPDGTPVRSAFFLTTVYAGTWMSESPTFVKKAWHAAMEAGNEIGNHTHSHAHGDTFSVASWESEMQTCLDWLAKPFDPDEPSFSPNNDAGIGADRDQIYGFRTPFLEYNDATFTAMANLGFRYDCSIEEGYQPEQDGTNYFWPFTLDNGSPGHDVLVEWGLKEPLGSHPGVWSLPVHPVIVPPDDRCDEYGVPAGLRAKMKSYQSWFDEDSGKITGFDYNLWVLFKMTKAEFLATLKYTLDLRLEGNRAPMMFGAHTDYYSSKYTAPPNATVAERQQAIEEFLDYALSKPEVRVVSHNRILEWVRNPVTLP